jgi:VWFA-related protein
MSLAVRAARSYHERVNNTRRTGGLLAALTAAALGSAAPSRTSSAPRGPQQQDVIRPVKPLEHDVTVSLKLIQVYVTDSKGRPVPDLSPEDFVVTDNEQPVSITEFERHLLEDSGTAAAPARTPPAEAAPQAETTAAPARLPAKYLFLFDLAFNNLPGAKKGKAAALKFLETQVKPGDEVGILTYTLVRGLRLHEFLTSDIAKVREAVDALSTRDAAGRFDEMEQQYLRYAIEGEPATGIGGSGPGSSTAGMMRQESKVAAQLYFERIAELARALRYVPGQKNLLLFSMGVPSSLLYGIPVANVTRGGAVDHGDKVLRTKSDEMARELSAANISVFTFDTRESARVTDLFAWDEQTFLERSRNMGGSSGVYDPYSVFKDEKMTGLGYLRMLSQETGGQYFGNVNRAEKNLERMAVLTGSYYVLGYAIGERWDGKFHAVKVQVKRRGCEVHAQAGYFNPKPFSDYTDLEKRLHLFDLALSARPVFQTPLAASLAALAAPGGAGGSLVTLARLPAETVAKLGGGRVEIVSFVFDEREKLADIRRAEDSLDRFRDKALYYASSSTLPAGDYLCRIVIRSRETGQAAAASARVHLPAAEARPLRLYAPLLLVAPEANAYLEGQAAAGIIGPSWQDYYPFDPARHAPLLGPIRAGLVRFAAVVPCAMPGVAAPTFAFGATATNMATGKSVAGRVELFEGIERNGILVLGLDVDLGDLPAGTYTLYLKAEESGTRAVAVTRTSLVVR